MFLSKLYIKNYRSISEIEISFSKGKNIIVGKNNAGKSNIFKALNLVLGENSPTYEKSNNITESDFYSWKENIDNEIRNKTANEIFIWCELKRENGELLNYEEIYKCYGFYKMLPRLIKEKIPENYKYIFEFEEDEIERSDKLYVNPKLKNQKTFEQEFDNKYSFGFAFFANIDKQNKIHKEMRFLYRENDQSDWVLAFKPSIRNEFLQSAIIPSFRDPQNQLRLNEWTWYGKLMMHLTEKHLKSKALHDAFAVVKEVADEVFSSVKNEVASTSLNVAFPGTELHFQFHADSKDDIYKNCVIYIDDGFKSLLTEKGAGIQSATLIGLFNFYTREVNIKNGALLCVEEPELYLHPHARRVISDRLDDFIDNDKNQVIITTHSPEFIRTTDDSLNIILLKKNNSETTGFPINIRSSKSLLLNNNHNEIFFADKVIICEGFDDYILRWVAKEKFPKQLDEKNISIVTGGGKDNFKRFIELTLKLQIDCYLFSDFDYFLRDSSEAAEKYKEDIKDKKTGKIKKIKSFKHLSLADVEKGFFKQKCIFGDSYDREIETIKKLRQIIKTEEEKNFYKSKTVDELQNRDEMKLHLTHLRKNGIGILEGEIENLSLDSSFLSSENKLSLQKIFEISTMLVSGKEISTIIDTAPIEEFLTRVFQE